MGEGRPSGDDILLCANGHKKTKKGCCTFGGLFILQPGELSMMPCAENRGISLRRSPSNTYGPPLKQGHSIFLFWPLSLH